MNPSTTSPPSGEPQTVTLVSTSRAADGGYLALADLAAVAAAIEVEYRILGGHMVTLLVAVHGVTDQVPLRETLDADFGTRQQVVANPRLLVALRDRGYAQSGAANRFVRQVDDRHGKLDLVVDILAPSYLGRLRSGQRHGDLVVDEVPGLGLALTRRPTAVDLAVRLTDGGEVRTHLVLPDLMSALCIKALAYRGRFAEKDAVDLWRLMNAAYASGLRADSWPTTAAGRLAADVLMRFFGKPSGTGLVQLSASRIDQARMRAMIRAVVDCRGVADGYSLPGRKV